MKISLLLETSGYLTIPQSAQVDNCMSRFVLNRSSFDQVLQKPDEDRVTYQTGDCISTLYRFSFKVVPSRSEVFKNFI